MSGFFVPQPFVPEGFTDESAYTELAKFAGARPQPLDRRISSITWVHDGQVWNATVGQLLHGTETRKRQRNKQPTMVTTPLTDAAQVVAIFAGPPCYLVVTDARPLGRQISAWVNPLMAGQPREVVYFGS